MSTAVPPENGNPAASPSTEATGSSTPTPPANPAPTEFRFGDDAPQWARGRSASEILGLVEQQHKALEGFVRQAPPAQPVQQAYQPAPTAYTPPAPDDYVTGQTLNQYGQQFRDQFQPDLQHVINSNADMALDVVKRRYPEHFAKYGPEITANLASLSDKRAWTIDNLDKVVKFTLVDHVDDIARERAARIAAEMEPTLRSTGAGGFPISQPNANTTLQSEKLPNDWKERAAKAGLTEQAVTEFCQVNGMTREAFLAQFEKTAISEIARG